MFASCPVYIYIFQYSTHGEQKNLPSLFSTVLSYMLYFIVHKIDSIMSTRVVDENESSRRLKSEFLVQFDGVTSKSDDLVIVIGELNLISLFPLSTICMP